MAKTVKIFNDDFSEVLTDITNLSFLDYDEEGVEVRANTLEVKGQDGVKVGSSTFGPFNLVLRFFYRGYDINDYNLLKQKLRGVLYRRDPYYVVHSDMPGKKYSVYCSENAITDIGDRFGTFEITFVVYKGYSESLKDTTEIGLFANEWAFENNLITDRDISYKNKGKRFEIFNGSTDEINPLNHNFIIRLKIDAPNGFTIRNHTTKEAFIFYDPVKYGDTFIINGVHPILNNKRVGYSSNFDWVSLARGFNNFEIDGNGVTNVYTEFEFNFIYR